MKDDTIAGLVLTLIAILLTWLVVHLIKNKFNNPESTTQWGGIAAAAFFALIFILFSGVTWFGLFIQSKSIEIDADFVGVKPDSIFIKQDGEKIYQWRLECRWNDPVSGKQIMLKSEPFEGTDLYYNRSKIKVSVYPDKADTFYEVDLSYITNQESGIKLITEKMLQEANRKQKLDQERNQAYEKDQEVKREEGRGLTVLFNRIVFAGTALLILIALVVGVWYYFRSHALQNRILEFTSNTEKELKSLGWSFTFQPSDRPWEGVGGMLKQEVETLYPEGFVEIKGNTNETRWTLDMEIKRESARGYYRSPQDYWLKNSSYSRLTIPAKLYQDDTFIAFMEIPKSFPDKIKSALGQSQALVEPHYFADITAEADRDILHEYIYVLFDPYRYKSALHKSNQTQRWGEQFSNTLFLTITNTPNGIEQFINQKVKADLREIGKSEKGGYGILISRDGIMVSTLSVSLKPNEIQRMVDLGMMVKNEINKKH